MRHLVAASLAIIVLAPAAASAQKLVIVVRHAERADGGAGVSMAGAPADPLLSAAGEARAAKLAGMLEEAAITAIVVTEFRRTQDTAKPIAAITRLRQAPGATARRARR